MKVVDWALNLAKRVGYRHGPQRTLDLLLRTGPHGDRYLPWSVGLNLRKVQAAPHGVDLGPAPSGIAHRLFHRDRRVHLVAPPILQAMEALAGDLERPDRPGDLLLIGRRHLRSNNSWMHNVEALATGRDRCVLFVHPADAERFGLRDSQPAVMESRVHSGEVPVRVTDEVMEGVVSLPHGWGHAPSAPWQQVAGRHAGVSANDWTDDQRVESVVGQSILNGVPVRLRPAAERVGA
jgi:anaerobic selenocysteine-containing dehydrogenase